MAAPARALSAPVTSRRVPAGLTPSPGSLSRLPVWWGRRDWLDVEVPAVLDEHAELLHRVHVSRKAALSVASAMAAYADAGTGRHCRPTNERLVEDTGLSLSTVQRARRVLKELGLVVEVVAGRSNMTLAQRLVAHGNGSSHRAIAAEFVLCSRRDRRPLPVENPADDLHLSRRDTPPVGKVERGSAREISGLLRRKNATRKAAPRPAHTEKSGEQSAAAVDVVTRRLVRGLQRRHAWLAGVHPHRLTFQVRPYAQQGWSDRDFELAIPQAMAARGWHRVPANMSHPWAYLARLLEGVDPADRPTVYEDAHAAAEREHDRLQRHGAPCEHGVPGGDVVSPLTAQRGCPLCRAAAAR